ncbi:MAG: hypothetical protein IT481_08615 [Gammaproteobacteria bacterium]|nr:hypothetical protein [Gammaproteobacteria bacterium]
MADKRDDCADDIAKKTGRSRREVDDALDEMFERAEHHREGGRSPRDALGRAQTEAMDEEARRHAIFRRNMHLDALKSRDLNRFYEAARAQLEQEGPKASRLALEAALTGINRPLFDPKSRMGNQSSAAARSLGAKTDWVGGVVDDLRRISREDPALAGLDRIFFSRAAEDEIFIEKWQLDNPRDGKPGKTGNAAAKRIAEVLHKWDKVRVTALNEEGAWITDYAGYMTSVSHDPDKLRKAANQRTFRRGFTEDDRRAWVGDVLKWIDAERTFGGQEADKALAEMWGGLITGDHLDPVMPADGPIFPNVARKVSASRELHWKDAESQLAYMQKYGRFPPTEAWLHSMNYAADRYGLMKVFGSKPKEGFENLLAYAKNKTKGTAERAELDKWERALRNRYAVISGEAAIPVANILSGLVDATLRVQRMAKLGLTPFAMLQDNATISRELGRQGLSFWERNRTLIDDYFRGAPESAKRQVYELLHAGVLEQLHGATARWDVGDAKYGLLAKAENLFFKITGQTTMTANKRSAAERMMALNLGHQRGLAFGELDPGLARILQGFGIGDAEWALLGKAAWHDIEGGTYLTPDVARAIPDADMKAYLRQRGTLSDMVAAAGAVPPVESRQATERAALDRARQELGLKLWSYFSERGQYAVIEVGARERAILYQGTRPGEPLNLALRLIMQFKQFPTAMITRSWAADIYGGAKGMDRVGGLVELAVYSTIMGMAANYLNQLAKGQDPNSPWRNQPGNALGAAFLRGGAGSIYGDFLMGEWSRHGRSLLDTVAGPTLGQANAVAEVWADITHPTKWSKGTLALGENIARQNTPFANMIYTKAAVDYLIHFRLQEHLRPGYLERMERSMKDKQGIEFWLRPTQISR